MQPESITIEGQGSCKTEATPNENKSVILAYDLVWTSCSQLLCEWKRGPIGVIRGALIQELESDFVVVNYD